MADDVKLTDLRVIQQFSLAVRGSTATRAAVVAALEADLAWLRSAPDAPGRPAPDTGTGTGTGAKSTRRRA